MPELGLSPLRCLDFFFSKFYVYKSYPFFKQYYLKLPWIVSLKSPFIYKFMPTTEYLNIPKINIFFTHHLSLRSLKACLTITLPSIDQIPKPARKDGPQGVGGTDAKTQKRGGANFPHAGHRMRVRKASECSHYPKNVSNAPGKLITDAIPLTTPQEKGPHAPSFFPPGSQRQSAAAERSSARVSETESKSEPIL